MIKWLFCKHKFITITNLHGDMINAFDGARSIKKCKKCDKWIYSKKLDVDCKKVNFI